MGQDWNPGIHKGLDIFREFAELQFMKRTIIVSLYLFLSFQLHASTNPVDREGLKAVTDIWIQGDILCAEACKLHQQEGSRLPNYYPSFVFAQTYGPESPFGSYKGAQQALRFFLSLLEDNIDYTAEPDGSHPFGYTKAALEYTSPIDITHPDYATWIQTQYLAFEEMRTALLGYQTKAYQSVETKLNQLIQAHRSPLWLDLHEVDGLIEHYQYKPKLSFAGGVQIEFPQYAGDLDPWVAFDEPAPEYDLVEGYEALLAHYTEAVDTCNALLGCPLYASNPLLLIERAFKVARLTCIQINAGALKQGNPLAQAAFEGYKKICIKRRTAAPTDIQLKTLFFDELNKLSDTELRAAKAFFAWFPFYGILLLDATGVIPNKV